MQDRAFEEYKWLIGIYIVSMSTDFNAGRRVTGLWANIKRQTFRGVEEAMLETNCCLVELFSTRILNLNLNQ